MDGDKNLRKVYELGKTKERKIKKEVAASDLPTERGGLGEKATLDQYGS